MPLKHIVRKNECLSTIGARYGFQWTTIWNDPANKDLKQKRGNPNILLPGDEIIIPDKIARQEAVATERRSTFVVKPSTSRLRVKVLRGSEAYVNTEYRLELLGRVLHGRTDGKGFVFAEIPVEAEDAVLVVGTGESAVEFHLELGAMNPVDDLQGVQDRLRNLGFPCRVTGEMDRDTSLALQQFQAANNLDITGELDTETIETLEDRHGS